MSKNNTQKNTQEEESFLVSFGKDLLSVAAVLIAFMVLSKLAFGLWTPMVAVESGSMEPHMQVGDIIFIKNIDRADLLFGIKNDFDYIAASFVRNAEDVKQIKTFLEENNGGFIKVISKIENQDGVRNIDEIVRVSDGIMVARGDLGIEINAEEVPAIQKHIIKRANLAGKPVITATQMLNSMIESPRPTRAEVSDVANAILDGTDCIMLSGESAVGRFPEESVSMLARIANYTEMHRPSICVNSANLQSSGTKPATASEAISSMVENALKTVPCAAVFVPTRTGITARMISRFTPPVWIIAISRFESVCQGLTFSYGVHPLQLTSDPANWNEFAIEWLREHNLSGSVAMLVTGPSTLNPDANYRLEFIRISKQL